MTRRRALAAILVASAAGALRIDAGAAAVPQRYTPAAAPIAPVAMSTSCRPEAAGAVDAGAAWLLVRAPAEARAAFGRAVDTDPDCAVGHWGEALARADEAARGSTTAVGAIEASVGRALAVPARTPFERAAVAALRALRERVAAPGVPAAWPARFAAYRDALCAAAPADRLARLWCARALADVSAGLPHAAADALAHVVELTRARALDAGEAVIVLEVAPDPQAPIVARALAAIASANPPARVPHALAAWTAIRRGEWTAAVTAAERARAATGAADAGDAIGRDVLDAQLEALFQLGRRADAYAIVHRAGKGPDAARFAARVVLGDRRLDGRGLADRATLALDATAAAAWPIVFVDGLDAALGAWPGGDATRIARARAAATALDALTPPGLPSEPALARTLIDAAVAASQDEHPELALRLAHAVDLERALVTAGRVRVPLIPARELGAELWLRTYRYDDARREARALLEAQPQRVSPYVVLARAAARTSDPAAAADAWRRVLELRAAADPDDTLRAEARQAVRP
jgi:hypothetical protein